MQIKRSILSTLFVAQGLDNELLCFHGMTITLQNVWGMAVEGAGVFREVQAGNTDIYRIYQPCVDTQGLHSVFLLNRVFINFASCWKPQHNNQYSFF